MHGNDGFRETGVVLVGSEMKFSDGDDAMAGSAQAMMPARY
jgi:hypothetical protein